MDHSTRAPTRKGGNRRELPVLLVGVFFRRPGRGHPPVRGCLVEAVGARPFRAKAKRREASVAGESAGSDEARFPLVSRAYGRRDGLEVSWSYPARSAGFRASGRP